MSPPSPSLSPNPVLDAATTAELAVGIAVAELGSEQRARLRHRILQRVRAAPPPGMRTLRAREGEWLAIAPGVERKVLREDHAAARVSYLVRMQPGAQAPHHPHDQAEECLVLEGDVLVGEHRLDAGDWHVAEPGSVHADFRTIGGCLLFIQGEMRVGS